MKGKAKNKRDGQALVEFALCLPIFLLLFFGIVDFGRLIYNQHLLTSAATQACRVGIISPSSSSEDTLAICESIVDKTLTQVPWFTDPSDVSPSSDGTGGGGAEYSVDYQTEDGICYVGSDGDSGDIVTVTITHTYNPWFPMMLPFLTDFEVTGRAVMRHE